MKVHWPGSRCLNIPQPTESIKVRIEVGYELLRTWGYIQLQAVEKSIKNNVAWFFLLSWIPRHSLSDQALVVFASTSPTEALQATWRDQLICNLLG